jgi:hypothetical protein
VYREPGHVQLHVPAPSVRPNTELPDRLVVRPGVEIPRTTGPATSTVTPGTDVGTVGGVTTNPTLPEGTDLGGGTTTPPEETPPEENVAPALTCTLGIARVPRRNARFSLQGTGFDESVVVQVGGTLQTVRSFTETTIEAQTDRAGEVVVVRGEERVSCGRLALF